MTTEQGAHCTHRVDDARGKAGVPASEPGAGLADADGKVSEVVSLRICEGGDVVVCEIAEGGEVEGVLCVCEGGGVEGEGTHGEDVRVGGQGACAAGERRRRARHAPVMTAPRLLPIWHAALAQPCIP